MSQQLILLQKDNTYTKLFVGGLPYHTTDETLREFFAQFGDLDEAVVIIDKTTKKSKGYGFVTMADKEGAERACANPNPYIDGRRANVNLAYLGAKPKHGSQPGSPAGHAGYQSTHGSPPPSPPIPLPLSPPAGYPGPSPMMPPGPQPAFYYELPYGPNASLYPATFYPFNPQLYGTQFGYIPPHFLPPSPQMVQPYS